IVMNGSQVHYGFGLFHRTMDSPLIKRDLLLRGLLFEHDCARILDYMPAQQREPIMRELLNRGRSVNVGGFRRFKLRNGLL
ncbi:MAG TPA: lipopolysaccharide biosynthesis protein, partial [Ochrobactrum anthropi]|nr:lipopolysaccharide biosynthesis protein [Brucella anthropi]